MVNRITSRGVAPITFRSAQAGRLQHFISNWEVVTKDRWVLNTVQGYRMEFHTEPFQASKPQAPHHNQEQTQLIWTEVQNLMQKGAVALVTNHPGEGFHSTLFLVPKKDGGQRPVINLKPLNEFVETRHFKMEGIHTLKDLLRPKDWLAKVDLKDAYFTIPIHQSHRKYLRFSVQNNVYEFTCLPFGLSSAPWVFTKTLRPLAALVRELGMRAIFYIDDILVVAESEEILEDQTSGLLYLIENLGFTPNKEKLVLDPTQTIEFLGFTVDTVNMVLKLPGDKIKKIRAEARKMKGEESVSARALARLIGKMNATKQVIPPAPLFYRHLQRDLSGALNRTHQNYDAQLTLSRDSLEELDWWDTHMTRWNGKSVLKKDIDLVIDSDASLTGWGAVCQDQRTGGPWSNQEKEFHINCLELLAATLALKTFTKGLKGISVLLRIDNTSAVAYINNQGGTVSRDLVHLTRELWMWALERNIHLIAQHLPGSLNDIADAESRVMRDRSDWMLDPGIFHRINQTFGPIEVDLFASRLTHQCQVYFSWRPDPYAAATDAFLQDWTGMKGFANPPWNLIGRVLAQTQSQEAQIVLVAPVWKSQPWYPVLLGMLIDYPCLIHHTQQGTDSQGFSPQLAVWHISGKDTEPKIFQNRLRTWSSSHGGQKQTNPMIHSLGDGLAGAVNGVRIPFQDL